MQTCFRGACTVKLSICSNQAQAPHCLSQIEGHYSHHKGIKYAGSIIKHPARFEAIKVTAEVMFQRQWVHLQIVHQGKTESSKKKARQMCECLGMNKLMLMFVFYIYICVSVLLSQKRSWEVWILNVWNGVILARVLYLHPLWCTPKRSCTTFDSMFKKLPVNEFTVCSSTDSVDECMQSSVTCVMKCRGLNMPIINFIRCLKALCEMFEDWRLKTKTKKERRFSQADYHGAFSYWNYWWHTVNFNVMNGFHQLERVWICSCTSKNEIKLYLKYPIHAVTARQAESEPRGGRYLSTQSIIILRDIFTL